MFSSLFMLFPTLKKKSGVGGGGGVEFLLNFFLEKLFFLIYAIFNIKKILKPPIYPSIRSSVTFSLLVMFLNWRWLLQIVDSIDSLIVGIYIHYILYSLVLILYLNFFLWGGGEGVMFLSYFMLFPTFLDK